MTNKHTEGCSTLLAINKMQIKMATEISLHIYQNVGNEKEGGGRGGRKEEGKRKREKKLTISSTGKKVEQLEITHTAGETVK